MLAAFSEVCKLYPDVQPGESLSKLDLKDKTQSDKKHCDTKNIGSLKGPWGEVSPKCPRAKE